MHISKYKMSCSTLSPIISWCLVIILQPLLGISQPFSKPWVPLEMSGECFMAFVIISWHFATILQHFMAFQIICQCFWCISWHFSSFLVCFVPFQVHFALFLVISGSVRAILFTYLVISLHVSKL